MSHQPEKLLSCPFCGHHPDPNNLIDSLHPTGIYGHLINPQDVSEGVYFSLHSAGSVFDCWKFSCLESEGGCGADISGESRSNVIDKWNRRTIASVKREPLKDGYILDLIDDHRQRHNGEKLMKFARAIEQAHGIGATVDSLTTDSGEDGDG